MPDIFPSVPDVLIAVAVIALALSQHIHGWRLARLEARIDITRRIREGL